MVLSHVLKAVTWAGLLLMMSGCAVGNPGDIPCTDDADCPAGRDCDAERLICVQASITTNADPSNRTSNNRVPPNSSSSNDNSDMGNNDENNTNNNEPDMGPDASTNNDNNTNPNNTNNTNNTNTCSPACEAPGTCVNGACEYPDCGAALDPCDPTTTSQNGFTCVDIEGQGLCLDSCSRIASVDVCATGEYCVGWDGEAVCLPSICDTNADCTDGTTTGSCLHIANDFNFCKQAGTLAANAPCDPADDQCGVDHACDPLAEVCEPVCDPYGARTCGAGHYCASFWSPSTGICSHDTATASPLDAFDVCDPAGSVCNDAVACFSFTQTIAACLKFCRPGMNDCAGVLTGPGDPTICDPYYFYTPGTGACWPACALDSDCGTGFVCANQLCRAPCTAGNEVADCCGGSSPCPAICNNNLCE